MFTDALLCILVLPVDSAYLVAQYQDSSGAQELTNITNNEFITMIFTCYKMLMYFVGCKDPCLCWESLWTACISAFSLGQCFGTVAI